MARSDSTAKRRGTCGLGAADNALSWRDAHAAHRKGAARRRIAAAASSRTKWRNGCASEPSESARLTAIAVNPCPPPESRSNAGGGRSHGYDPEARKFASLRTRRMPQEVERRVRG